MQPSHAKIDVKKSLFFNKLKSTKTQLTALIKMSKNMSTASEEAKKNFQVKIMALAPSSSSTTQSKYVLNTNATFVPKKKRGTLGNPFDMPKLPTHPYIQFFNEPSVGLKYANAMGYNYYLQVYISGRYGRNFGDIDLEKFITRGRDNVIFRRDGDDFIIACFDTIEERNWAIGHIRDCCEGRSHVEIENICVFVEEIP